MAGHNIRADWDFKDGKFTRKEKPFANYIPPSHGEHEQAHPPAKTASAKVAEARARWDEARREGNPDRMTRTANDLLRAAEAERAAPEDSPNATPDESKGRDLISETIVADEPVAATELAGEDPSEEIPQTTSDSRTSTTPASLWTPESGPPIERQLRPLLEERSDTASQATVTPASWTRPVPESDYYPSQPFDGGLQRMKRARHRRGTVPAPHRGRRHWADPDVGWDQETIDETIGGWDGEVTPELLLIFSQQAYGNEHARLPRDRAARWSRRRPDGSIDGWQYLGDRKADGYFGMALYNEKTNTLVIASRGTTGFLDDVYRAALPITRGEHTRQMDHAQALLITAWRDAAQRARARGLPPPRLVLTGHSLGGAMAEVQLARVYADPELSGVDVSVVTFAALGADRVVPHVLRRWGKDRAGLDRFASGRAINYYREGDGITTNRVATGPDMPKRLGTDVVLAGLDMDATQRAEREAVSREGEIGGILSRQDIYRGPYASDHSLLTFYHRDFTDPLQAVFKRRRSRRPSIR